MDGDAGVQKILRKIYTMGLYFHCTCNKSNIAVNDFNGVSLIRNCMEPVTDIINVRRELILHRKYATNIPLMCETSWSYNY